MNTAQRLSKAVSFDTISNIDPSLSNVEAFVKLREFFKSEYPNIHNKMTLEIVSPGGLMYHLKGKNNNNDAVVFLGHMDVVPVLNPEVWKHPPFEGFIDDKYVWGRGSIDMKAHIICLMDAMEELLKNNFQSEKDIYFCFGQNEEVGSLPKELGAPAFVEILKKRKVNVLTVLDEGGGINDGAGIGINGKCVNIGVCEKSIATFVITAKCEGGHSATPGKTTAVGKIAKAAVKIESHPFKPRLCKTYKAYLMAVKKYLPFSERFLVSNLWCLKPLLFKNYSKDKAKNAMIRTTAAVTMTSGGKQSNVLPTSANITVNCRILPGETVETTRQRLIEILGDNSYEIVATQATDVLKESNIKSKEYDTLCGTIKNMFGDLPIIPNLLAGGTDSKYYYEVCDNVYRFSPFYIPEELSRTCHGDNERAPIEMLDKGVKFFVEYIDNISK